MERFGEITKEVKKADVSMFDIEELACVITGMDYYHDEVDSDVIFNKLYDELEIDTGMLHEIVSRLLPLVCVAESALTGEKYKGFSDLETHGWIIKTEIE